MKKTFVDRFFTAVAVIKWVYAALLIFALAFFVWLILFYDSCVVKNKVICHNDEYFIYRVTEDNKVHVIGLTDKGKEQEYIIIPEKIDGKTVNNIGCTNATQVTVIEEKYGSKDYAQIKSDNLKKIFLTSDVQIINARFTGKAIQSLKYEGTMFILNTSSWSGEKAYKSSYATTSISIRANVSYFYNYENSPNDGYYWIDNYDYGEKVEFIPPVPTRAGYTFGGWYKESECINKWNFEIDRLPDYLFSEGTPPDPENYRPIYQETKLYAKWIEKA